MTSGLLQGELDGRQTLAWHRILNSCFAFCNFSGDNLRAFAAIGGPVV